MIMNSSSNPAPDRHGFIHRIFGRYLRILFGVTLALAILHWFFPDLRMGRVYWFNLDKERNIATWFSGSLFFLLGCAAVVTYYWEKNRIQERPISASQFFGAA